MVPSGMVEGAGGGSLMTGRRGLSNSRSARIQVCLKTHAREASGASAAPVPPEGPASLPPSQTESCQAVSWRGVTADQKKRVWQKRYVD